MENTMSAKNPCTNGPRHKWDWVKDVTNVKVSITSTATRKTFSRRGVFKCECGATREGQPRTGL
jgi:hypothetical protein